MDLNLAAFIPNREFLAVPYKPAYFWVRQVLRTDVTVTYTVYCPVRSWKKRPTLFHFLISSVLWALVSCCRQHTPMEINRQRNNIGRSQSFSFATWCVFLPSGSSQLLMCLCQAHPIWQGPAVPLLGPCSSSSSLKDSGRFTSTGGLAWMSKETSLSPWPCGGCCMSDVQSYREDQSMTDLIQLPNRGIVQLCMQTGESPKSLGQAKGNQSNYLSHL